MRDGKLDGAGGALGVKPSTACALRTCASSKQRRNAKLGRMSFAEIGPARQVGHVTTRCELRNRSMQRLQNV